ncbi:MAG: hypothetical protein QXV16_02465 [Candidatus Anstonellales archaeon]
MKLISYIGDHPVYYSIYRALETIGFNIDRLDKVLYNIDLGNSYIAIRDIRRRLYIPSISFIPDQS